MASGSFPGTNMTPCLSHFWLFTPQLTHSLTKHADWYAYSYMLIPCLPIDYKAPIVLLQIPQHLTHFCLPFPAYWSAYWSSPMLTDQLTHSLLICAYPIAYWSLTNPLLFSYQSPLLLHEPVRGHQVGQHDEAGRKVLGHAMNKCLPNMFQLIVNTVYSPLCI